jgi:23S rRNA (uracil1939-C5)-methyltransferase
MEEVVITKLVHGGQGLGELADGRKVFVWNALPGERVRVRVIKEKRSYAEAIAEEVVSASPERVEPLEANYLATSPWQMMTFAAENHYKSEIVNELITQAGISTSLSALEIVSGKAAPVRSSESEFISEGAMENPPGVFHYRNKMEYRFWSDDDGLHLALHQRGSHGKEIVQGSALALPAVDAAAQAILAELRRLNVRASYLKTVIVRCNQKGESVASLFVKPSKFSRLKLSSQVKGLRIYHSNPRSPASVPTKLLHELGDCTLSDTLLGRTFHYDVDSFFQVNLPVYERALESIRAHCEGDPVDMYAGVGSIGLSVAEREAILVELDARTVAMARANACDSPVFAEVIESSAEKALEYIDGSQPVIFDPPRAGLHPKVVERCLEAKPPRIIYLSCNPATQARDLALLQQAYVVRHFEVFNFFPRTPHIETLAVLSRK